MSFSTKTKQTTFSFGQAGTKQMKTEEIFSFSTKTKQMTFSLARTKQRKTNGIIPFSYTEGIQHFHFHMLELWVDTWIDMTITRRSTHGKMVWMG
jgi:hypothetical protein